MESSEKLTVPEKIEKICLRLQTLLDQWTGSVPLISNASATTLTSQFTLYSKVMKDCPNKVEWAMHDMPYLLMQTLSQLWDKEGNIELLLSCGMLNAVRDMYAVLAPILLALPRKDDNRFAEWETLFATLVPVGEEHDL